MTTATAKAGRIWSGALALLALGALRVTRLNDMLNLTNDEVWSTWQAVDGPRAILARTPFDWPSGYFLLLGGWQALVGQHPVMLRYGMALCFLMGAAAMYRAGRRWWGGHTAGLLVMTVYGFGGWAIYMSTLVRGHGLTFALAPAGLWLALRYFDAPSIRRGVPLAVVLASLLYVHATTGVFYVALGLFTLAAYGPWRAVRLWVPVVAGMGLLVLPELINKLGLIVDSRQSLAVELNPLPELLWDYFGRRAPQMGVWWLVLMGAGLALALWRARKQPTRAGALAIWIMFPLVMLLPPLQDLFTPRYTNWYMAGLALAVGGGLAAGPRPVGGGAVVALLVVGALPYDLYDYDRYGVDAGTTFADLADAMHAGDVLLVDPNIFAEKPVASEKWDYYREVFFPAGMPLLEAEDYLTLTADGVPAGAWNNVRRVWYLRDREDETPGLRDQLRETHIRREFFGPPGFFAELYEGPPDLDGVAFENGMRFHGADVLEGDGYNTHFQPVFREQDTVRLRTWWSVDESPELDYSVGLYMLDRNGVLEASEDVTALVQLSPGEDAPEMATSTWEPGMYYTMEHTLPTTDNSDEIMLAVYQWWDNVRVEGEETDENGLYQVLDFALKSW